ncbi:MAG: DUF4190 domain-containing protein [Acidimicrobiales bacterium]|nr:DUF4190 domain-containing protein [Acidimicrobiales bacterium]
MTDETGAGEGPGDLPLPDATPAGSPPSSNPPPGWSWGDAPAPPTPPGPPDEPPTMVGGTGPVVPGPYQAPPPGQYNPPAPGQYGAPPPGQYNPPVPGQYNPPPPGQYGAPQAWGPPVSSPYGVVPASPPTDNLAIASLITGLVSIVAAFACCLGGLIGVAAVVLGVMSRKRIGQSNGLQSGSGLALAGIITGSIGTVLGLLSLAFFGFLFTLGSATSAS